MPGGFAPIIIEAIEQAFDPGELLMTSHPTQAQAQPQKWLASPMVFSSGIFVVLLVGTVLVSTVGWLDTWYGQVLALLISLTLAAAGSWLYATWRDNQPRDHERLSSNSLIVGTSSPRKQRGQRLRPSNVARPLPGPRTRPLLARTRGGQAPRVRTVDETLE